MRAAHFDFADVVRAEGLAGLQIDDARLLAGEGTLRRLPARRRRLKLGR